MRVLLLALTTATVGHVHGFTPTTSRLTTITTRKSTSSSSPSSSSSCLYAELPSDSQNGPTRTKPMSAEELKAKMGIQDDEPPPKLFSDSLYTDMQQTLLMLEKRIKQGPGSLSMLEVEELSAQTQRIATEMREFEVTGGVAQTPSAAATAAVPKTPSSPAAATAAAIDVVTSKEAVDISDNDGPAYEGEGGLGLASGTRNTYIIPGMDEMSPEEYQKALQDSIIERQKKRVGSKVTGNRATWDYLNNLTGESGVLKNDQDEESP